MHCQVLKPNRKILAKALAVVLLGSMVFGFFKVNEVSASAGWVIGKFGKTYDFNGVAYVDAGNVYNGVKTVAFWVKGTTAGTVVDLNGAAYVSISAGSVVSTTGFDSATIYVDGVVGTTVNSNWHYVVITNNTAINASAVKFGSNLAGNLVGSLDDVKMYNYALSAREINDKYRQGAPSLAQGGTASGDLYVMNNGKFGIGTTTPSSLLTVAGNSYFTGNIGVGTTTPATKLDVYGSLQVGTSTTPTLTPLFIANTGSATVGIGTTTPASKFSIAGAAGVNALQISSTTGAVDLILDQYGNLGIATSSPLFKLAVEGDTFFRGNTTTTGNLFVGGNTTTTGQLYIGATTTFAANLVPSVTNTYDVGTTNYRWNEGWFNTVNIGTSTWSINQPDNQRLSFWNGASGTGVEKLTVTQLGYLGISTSSPSALLAITGTSTIASLKIASSSGANQLSIDEYGLVNFGIPDNQATAMTVSEGSNTYLTYDTTDGSEKIVVGKDFEVGLMEIDADSGAVNFVNMDIIATTTATGTAESLSVALDGNAILTVYGESTGYTATLQNAKVGVGTTTPSARLAVAGLAGVNAMQISSTTGAVDFMVGPYGNIGIGTSSPSQRFSLVGRAGLDMLNLASPMGNSLLLVDQYGRIGIGTSSPVAALDIYATSTQLRIASSTGFANFYVDGSGNLNIDTSFSTTSAFQITGSNLVANQPMQFNSPGDVSFSYDLLMANSSAGYMKFQGAGYIQTESPYGNYNLTLSAANAGKVVIDDNLQTTGQTQFVATTTQVLNTTTTIQVGGATHIVVSATATVVMISAPTIADGVAGDIIIIRNAAANSITLQDQDTLASSNLQLGATGRALTNGSTIALMFDGTDWMELWYSGVSHADYAEMYRIKDDVDFAEVVSVDESAYLRVKKAILGDQNVAGIISAQPAYLIGQEFRNEMQMPVALAGRVPVKISLEAGEIKKGDVLVPSTKPGYAMKYNEEYLVSVIPSDSEESQNFDILTSQIPIVGIALEDYGASNLPSEFLETIYKIYKVKFKEGGDSADINRLNAKYRIKDLTSAYAVSDLVGGWRVIEVRAEYEQTYLRLSVIENSQWLSENTVRQPNPEFHGASSETVLCMVKSGYVRVSSGLISKLTIKEENGRLIVKANDENMQSFGLEILADGAIQIAKLRVDELQVGSSDKRTGITIYDEDTGQPYCLKMKAGAMISQAGQCGEPTSQNIEILPPPSSAPTVAPPSAPAPSPNIEISTSSQPSSDEPVNDQLPIINNSSSTEPEPVITEPPVVEEPAPVPEPEPPAISEAPEPEPEPAPSETLAPETPPVEQPAAE